MAVYTDVSDEDLNLFLKTYDLGSLRALKGIAEGVENSNYLLHTDAGHFILTLYEKRVAHKDLPFFLDLMNHLSSKGINCPVPIKNSNGETLSSLSGRPAAIVTFLDGMWVRRPQPHHCAMLGEALAKMHIAAADFSTQRVNALSVANWRQLFAPSENHADTVFDGLAGSIQTELDALETTWPTNLPQGVIHADLFPDNVFFLGPQLSGLIDFYFACNDTLAYDVAICINAWCFEYDLSFNITKARALLSAYSSVRPFSPDEYDALPLLARGASLRFLLTRLYDWLNVPDGALVTPKNPLEYQRKLRFHQSVKDARDYGLDR